MMSFRLLHLLEREYSSQGLSMNGVAMMFISTSPVGERTFLWLVRVWTSISWCYSTSPVEERTIKWFVRVWTSIPWCYFLSPAGEGLLQWMVRVW
jgi:hypothetical protein